MLIARNPDVYAAELDGEICLFEPTRAEYLNLNESGSRIWNLLETPLTLDQLTSRLQELFTVNADTCLHDTATFISEALQRGMLQEQAPS